MGETNQNFIESVHESIEVEKNSKKYLMLQNNSSIYLEGEKVFKNDIEPHSETKSTLDLIINKLMSEFYGSYFFANQNKNIVVLTGAGTSMNNGENKGPTRAELLKQSKPKIDKLKALLKGFKVQLNNEDKDIEKFLSLVSLTIKLFPKTKIREIIKIKEEIEKNIVESCNLKLDDKAPHLEFLNKITARKLSLPRIQIFTTNYDTLFEQAANRGNFVVIDGFSFQIPRKYSARNFDFDIVNRNKTRLNQEESYLSKVFHLYKLHGSLNWYKETIGNKYELIYQKEQNASTPVIIYPSSDKFENTFEKPYSEMMSRFIQTLRNERTLLIVIGFGFQDKHIQNAIFEAVEQNPGFELFIVNYSGNNNSGINTSCIEDYFLDTSKMNLKHSNVTIVNDSFESFVERFPKNETYIENFNRYENQSF